MRSQDERKRKYSANSRCFEQSLAVRFTVEIQ
nr:MAG TPA: hypothetical protein [Caudoviricetes sp.]